MVFCWAKTAHILQKFSLFVEQSPLSFNLICHLYVMKGMGGYTIFHYFPTILRLTMGDQVM